MSKILFPIPILICLYTSSFCQEINEFRNAQEVIETFFDKIGGHEKWNNLQTRIEYSTVIRHDDSEHLPINNSSDMVNYFKSPNYNMMKKLSFQKGKYLKVYTPGCSWYYFEILSSILFFDFGTIKKSDRFPRTEFSAVFNLKFNKKVEEDNLHYILEAIDARRKDGVQRLYFNKETLLLEKRTWLGKDDVLWSFLFEKYVEKKGFKEPYEIIRYGNMEAYSTTSIDDIKYNESIDSNLFTLPVPCGEPETHVQVDKTLLIDY